MPRTATINIPSKEIENLISATQEYGPADIVDDGSKINTFPDFEDETLALVTPTPDEGFYVLLNLRYRNEKLFRPYQIPDTKEWKFNPQDSVQFIDGYLTCDRATADWVKSAAPYVYEEPTSSPDQPFTFDQTGFRTWHREAYDLYVQQYWESVN